MTTKTKAQHTPGPWEIRPFEGVYGVFSKEDNEVPVATTDYGGDMLEGADCQLTQEANARLIAAAPELLEACKTALSKLNELDRPVNCRAIQVLLGAIAKAEGRVS